MKKLLTIFFVLLYATLSFSQETEFKEYSYTEFFKLIEEEKDTIFNLKDAIIRFKAETDSAFIVRRPYLEPAIPIKEFPKIVVDKHIELENVHFSYKYETKPIKNDFQGGEIYNKGALNNIHFKKSVRFNNLVCGEILNCEFDGTVRIINTNICDKDKDYYDDKKLYPILSIGNNIFKKGIEIFNRCDQKKIDFDVDFFYNKLYRSIPLGERQRQHVVNINLQNKGYFIFYKNDISGNLPVWIRNLKTEGANISENNFNNLRAKITVNKHSGLIFNKNNFNNSIALRLDDLNATDIIDWKQFNNNFYSGLAIENYRSLLPDEEFIKTHTDSFRTHYQEIIRIQDAEVYSGEAAQKGILYRHYREKFDMVSANEVYINLKDFETKRLAYLYRNNPSFDTYFQWKVNQFLKLFSNYGTKPSKAITFSVYVVFFFALIYLFFPNSWDRHGKNRIINRYTFFTKYMNQNSGIHEVYLKDQKNDLLEYHEFKEYMESSGKSIPKFFSATALPLYKWAISGTKLSALILKRVDIMKGTWQELPQHKRFWKSILLIGAFIISIVYDLFIKMLNALMLSVNTFTTLGFGEIPIKGLPRYLAIVQGFIGWFMLTIFSVSLISQLLN